nr:hypothetical protein [Tanacetum cinerariifolium]
SSSANKKPEYAKSVEKKEDKRADKKKRDMSKVKCFNCKKEGYFSKDCKKAKDQAWIESSSDSDQEINANMVFMALIEKVLLDSDEKYYDNSTNYGLFVNNDDDQEIFHDAIKSASENFIENHIDSQKDYDKSEVDHNDSEEKLYDSFDENNLFIFDDESVRISPVSKMPFRKKPYDSLNIVQICLWIINLGCSKHMTGNHALLTNFVENFLGTVRFDNNDFSVIAGYGDVGLEVSFRKSTCFVRNEDGVDLLTGDHSSNLYTIALNEVASNSSTCLLGKASSLQSWLWHQRLSHLNFATINNLV